MDPNSLDKVPSPPEPPLKLEDGYRRARNTVSLFSVLAIAWSLALFELTKLNLGPVAMQLKNSLTVPVFLALTLVYTLWRCAIEYGMQPMAVRRWPLARRDFQVTLWLSRAAVLALGTTGIAREPIAFFAAYALLVLFASLSATVARAAWHGLRAVFTRRIRRESPTATPSDEIIRATLWSERIGASIPPILALAAGAYLWMESPWQGVPILSQSTKPGLLLATGSLLVLTVTRRLVEALRGELLLLGRKTTRELQPDGTFLITETNADGTGQPFVVREAPPGLRFIPGRSTPVPLAPLTSDDDPAESRGTPITPRVENSTRMP